MIIYAGPSLSSESIALIEEMSLDLRPPVKRGDIRKYISSATPEHIVIVDGLFHQVLSVGHEEIIDAIKQGWQVTGLSSMGAIRAFELRDLGMKGFGKVYQRFFEMEDFQDDELALFHDPEFPFLPYSEPMVHLRSCVEALLAEGSLKSNQATHILSELKKRYYGDRTFELFTSLLAEYIPNTESITLTFDQFRDKKNDLINFLQLLKNDE